MSATSEPGADLVDPGDDYFPEYGDLSYDVSHYDLRLDYRVDGNHLDGQAIIRAVARTDVDELHFDLQGLKASKVVIDGVDVAKFSTRRGKLLVRTKRVIETGEEFRLTVRYAGRPRPIPDGAGGIGWEELTDGVLVAGQTNGAGSWFPCNDRPANKATYRFEVTTASAYHVIANGELSARHQRAGSTTWVYEQAEPMATYLATLQIGRYVSRDVPGSPVTMRAVLPQGMADAGADYDAGFGRQGEMMDFFVRTFGPYPFGSYSVVITEDPLEIPLEAQGLSIFGANFVTTDWEAVRLVAHELSHQWFGNSLTIPSWRHIWLHEGFACYSEWLWSEESGGPSAQDCAEEHWQTLAEKPQDLLLGDPGADDMFDDRVYKRGALVLHALRLTVGDEAFFGLLQEWVRRHAYASVTTPMFRALAAEVIEDDLEGFFDEWLFSEALPPLPAPR